MGPKTLHILACQDQALRATRHWWGHAFFIRLYVYFNEQGRWGVLHRHERTASRFSHNLPINQSKASPRLSLVVSSSINHSALFAYFHQIIKERLRPGADDQSPNQWTRLNPKSYSVSQMAKRNSPNWQRCVWIGRQIPPLLPTEEAHVSARV